MTMLHPAWMGKGLRMSNARTPEETAHWEASQFFDGREERVRLVRAQMPEEAYEILETEEGYLVQGGKTGLLYGVYALIFALRSRMEVPQGRKEPYCQVRMLQCWDNMDGSIERGYAGRSLWFEENYFRYDPQRIRALGRMLSSVGINVLCINNVNVHWPAQELLGDMLPGLEQLADLFRPFGIRLMVSVDFAAPLRDGLSSADPLDREVEAWWKRRAGQVYERIPDLFGFLVKADSESRPGPSAYGRSHAEGANMLARALSEFGGTVVWRAFVYNCQQDWRDQKTDRPCAAYELYKPMDGQFEGNVILQVKNGPYDFQVREPLSPLFFGMPKTRLAMEVQLAQEYTGQQVDLFAMPPMWKDMMEPLQGRRPRCMAAVSNLGRDQNWTGHPLAQLNLFAYGRLAWEQDFDPETVMRQWCRLTYGFTEKNERVLLQILSESAEVYESYTAPLGLCWMVAPETHYGPSPYGYEFQRWGTYNRADRNGVGIDRTDKGTGFACQYPEPLRRMYMDPDTCPEKLLLFFHRLPYDYRLEGGKTLIQRIYDDHFEGYLQCELIKEMLERLPFPEGDRSVILERIDRQLANAREWRDVVNTFFYRLSGVRDEGGRTIYP